MNTYYIGFIQNHNYFEVVATTIKEAKRKYAEYLSVNIDSPYIRQFRKQPSHSPIATLN